MTPKDIAAVNDQPPIGAEVHRLREDATRISNWKRWGPYLAERQWGTVREDYSADGAAWQYFPHDHARSRVYRWGEDGLLGTLRDLITWIRHEKASNLIGNSFADLNANHACRSLQ